jgi:predicted permease
MKPGEMFLDSRRDLLHAGRSLAKARGFTFVCIATLGIGMAPVIAVPFWMRVFTTPPPGVKTEGLVELVAPRIGPRGETDRWSYPDYIDLRTADTGISMTGWAREDSQITLPASGEVKTAPTMFVSANYFGTIGVALARGPGFQETTDPVVIVGHGFWQNRLDSDPDVVGKTLLLGRIPHVVVGIAPDRFVGHLAFQDADLFVPLERHPRLLADRAVRFDRSKEWVHVHGRLSPGVGVGQASAAVAAYTSQLAREHPATNELKAGLVNAYHPIGSLEGPAVNIIRALWQAMALMPLLVVCLNIAGMVQVRSAMRERELSIRQALGASRGRLIRYLLAEAVILAAIGGALASLLIFNIPPLASWWIDEPIPVAMQEALKVDATLIAISVGLCLATSLLFGWLPASRFSRPVIITVLKDDAGGGGVRAGRVHRVTAALQVALAVPLLVLSALSLDRIRTTATSDFGFELDLMYAAPIGLDIAGGTDAGFQIRSLRHTLAAAAGVASVTVADGLPLDFRYRMTRVSLQTDASAAPTSVSVHVTRVGDGYLDTMGIPLLRGRSFTVDDGAGAEPVTIISKALADQLFPGADAAAALGQRLTFRASSTEEKARTLTIVGVAADFPTSQVNTQREQLLLPLAQHPDIRRDSVPVSDDRQGEQTLMIVARSAAGESPTKLRAALENALRELDPGFDPSSIVAGAELRQAMKDGFLDTAALGSIIGGVILMLAALGIYGVVGLMVSTRTREIAVRVTLGASRPRVIGMILFDVVRLVAPGVAAGTAITAALVRLDGGIMISSTEPLAYVAGGAIAMLTAVLSSLPPARRAASVEPMVAMKSI